MSVRNVFQMCEDADADVRGGPHGWIQWKGTDVCLDVHCSCGAHTHVDASFAYTVKCGACGKLWAVCANVRLIEITEADMQGRCTAVVSVVDEPDSEGGAQ